MELTKKQLAFVEAMESVGDIPEKATINFLTNDEHDGKFGGHYTTLADCWLVFNYGVAHERARCLSICEDVGDDGLDAHYAADEISRGEHVQTG